MKLQIAEWRSRLIVGILVLATGPGGLPAMAQEKVNYADWRLEWAEEFNTPLDTVTLSQRWRFSYPWGRSSAAADEDGYSTAETLSSSNGVLNMVMRRRATPILYNGHLLHYDTPMLMSRHTSDSLRPGNCNPTDPGFSYGLFEARVRQPKMTGSLPAFWLYGGAPDELDIFEANAEVLTNNFHWVAGNYWRPTRRREITNQSVYYSVDTRRNLHNEFHTYSVAWLPHEAILYFDGLPIRRETRYVPAGCAMSVIMNIIALNWAREAADTLVVDYIRIYRPRQLPGLAAGQRPGGSYPQNELDWLPAEGPPSQPDQGTHQTWQLAPRRRVPRHLQLLLTDNYNPPPDRVLPLPLDGEWAPNWYQTSGTPELRVQTSRADSVQWAVEDLYGRPKARGAVPGGSTWQPRWNMLPPGTYVLHLRQGNASMVHPLTIVERPSGGGPSPEWLVPVPLAPEP